MSRLLVALLLLAACERRPAATPAPDAAPVTRAAVPKPTRVMRKLAAITAEEVAGLAPTLPGARVLKPFAKAPVGQIVEGTWCFDQGEPATIAAEVSKQLTAAGWSETAVTAHPAQPGRLIVKARQAPYALFGNTMRGKWEECDGDKGRTFVKLGVHHVESVSPGAPATVPGRQDLRAPIR